MSKKLFGKFFIFLLVVGLLFAVAPTKQAQAATICVNPGGTDGCFASIQAAITAAGTGDTITVAAGSYNENVAIDKQVTLTGAGRDVTTVTAKNTIDPVFRVTADGVTISGFTLTGASGHQEEPFQDGDGINLDGADHCVVTDNAFIANRQGAYVTGSNNAFQRNIISNNISNGVILVADKDEPTHLGDNNTFDGNTIADNIKYGLNISTSNNTFINNTITGNDGCGVALFGGTSGNTINFNAISGNTGAGGVYSIASYTNDATKNWWGTATGPIHSTNPGATGNKVTNVDYSPWLGFVPGTSPMDWYLNTTGTIQDGIDAAANGETIHVLAGTYVEDVVVADKYFNLIGAVDTNGDPISILEGSLFINNPTYGNPPEFTTLKNIYFGRTDSHLLNLTNFNGGLIENCVFDGNNGFLDYQFNGINLVSGPNGNTNITVLNSTFKDGLYVGIGGYANGVTVTGSDFTNVKSGINMQGNGNLVVTDSTFLTKPVSDGDSYGIRYTAGDTTGAKSMTITGSTFEIDLSGGFTPASGNYHTSIYTRGTGLDTLTVEGNTILGGAVNTSLSATLDVSPNWWGSIAGPAAGTVVGTAEYAPWCGDAECSFLVYPMLSTGLQASIDATPAGGTLYVPAGTYTDGGADGYTVGGKTLILGDGVIIQNSSPCFTVTGSYTTITTESIGGAKCVPTSGANGIDVASALNNITIEGIEFDGTGQDTGDGIHFAGAIQDFVLVDNYLHDLDGDGIEFAGNVAEIVNIQGNMFKANGGSGINNLGANTVGAEYNSWGNVAGPAAGDGVSGLVTSTPFTHADLYLASSGTPWANQVVKGQNITYTVMAHLVNVNAADFVLTYPAELTYVSSAASGSMGTESVIHNESARSLQFIGYNTANLTGDLPLFTVTFTAANTVANAPLSFSYGTTSGFGMVGYESSSNVFVNEMVNGTVTVIDLPTISSTDIQGYYLTGEQRQFSVVLDNPSTGGNYAHVYTDFTITNAQVEQISLIEYSVDNGTNWVALGTGPGTSFANSGTDIVGYFGKMPGGGFALAPNTSLTTLFRVTFVTREQGATDFPTSYAVTMQLRDADALPASNLLDDLADTMYVYDKPTVTIGTDLYFLVGVPGDFSVTIVNPATGRNYGDSIVFDIVIEDHDVADISAVSCTMGTQTWVLTGALIQDGDDVTARIVGENGYFTVPAGLNAVINCSVTYATPGTYAVSGYMVEAIPLPERIVSDTYSATAQVYRQPVISSANLDGPFQAGLAQDVTLTITNPDAIPEPFDLVFSLPEGTVILYNGVTYTCSSTGCPVIPLVALAVPGDIDFTITFPVTYTAGTADISVSLYDRDTVGAPSPLATLDVDDVVVYANVASVTGTVSMQGRTTRAGVLFTLAGSFDTYTATSINTLSDNVSFANLASGVYAITVEQARYLDITIAHGAIIDLAELQAIANLMLRAGDANDSDKIDGGDASIVGTQYGTGTIADQGDVNFDNKVNIQDLALVGGNFDLQSTNPLGEHYAYGTWMR